MLGKCFFILSKKGGVVGLQKISLMGIIIILVYLPLTCNSLVFAEGWSIESLQKEIDARGYKWRAGKTSLSEGLTALCLSSWYI